MTCLPEDEERQPLLAKQGATEIQLSQPGSDLPWLPVLILALWRATHAVYFGYILTWITRFLIYNELADQNSVGTVAGWIESAYSLGVLVGLAPASYLSDTWGRKPTAITGVLFASIGTVFFGFAHNVTQLVALRFVNGFFVAFLPATTLTSLIELASPEALPYIFTINSVAWRFGILIAPFIGGFLAEPATYFPAIFAGSIWEKYPYALSGAVVSLSRLWKQLHRAESAKKAAVIPLFTVIIGIFVVPETLPADRRRSIWSLVSGSKSKAPRSRSNEAEAPAPLRGLFTRPVCFMLFLWGSYVFMQMTGVVAEVLFLSSPTKVGGLDFAPREMAVLYTARPLISSAINILLYPSLTRRYTTEGIFKWGITFNNTTFYGSYFAFGIFAAIYHSSPALNMVMLFILSIPMGINGSTSTACTQTLSSRAPSKAYLARMITATEYVANLGHGLGSLAGSNAWALAVTYNILHGQLVWLLLFLCALLLVGVANFLTKESSWQDSDDVQVLVEPSEES